MIISEILGYCWIFSEVRGCSQNMSATEGGVGMQTLAAEGGGGVRQMPTSLTKMLQKVQKYWFSLNSS